MPLLTNAQLTTRHFLLLLPMKICLLLAASLLRAPLLSGLMIHHCHDLFLQIEKMTVSWLYPGHIVVCIVFVTRVKNTFVFIYVFIAYKLFNGICISFCGPTTSLRRSASTFCSFQFFNFSYFLQFFVFCFFLFIFEYFVISLRSIILNG